MERFVRIGIVVVILLVIVIVGILILLPRQIVTGNTLSASNEAQIAFQVFEFSGLSEIYVYDQATQRNIQLTKSGFRIRTPVWSPDGQYLAFYYDPRERRDERGIYRLDVTTGEVMQLTPADAPTCFYPRWSPDGTQIICDFADRPGGGLIYMMQADGSDFSLVTEGSSASWSADGSKLLYIADETPDAIDDAGVDIAIYDLETGTSETVVELEGVENFPLWSPDETMIAFTELHYEPQFGGVDSQTLKIWDGETVKLIDTSTVAVPNLFTYEWSPDGTALRFVDCTYTLTADEITCRDDLRDREVWGASLAYSDEGEIAGVLVDNLNDTMMLCINPRFLSDDCMSLPEASLIQLVGWRPN